MLFASFVSTGFSVENHWNKYLTEREGFMNKDCHIILNDPYGDVMDTFNITNQIPEDKRPVILSVVNKLDYEKLEARLQVAVEALEFYKNTDSWDETPNRNNLYQLIKNDVLHDDSGHNPGLRFGGKRAREALEKIKAK